MEKNHSFGRCHVACLNAQSVRTSTHDIRDLIVDEKLDILFLTETWLYSSGDESCVADFTPTGYTTKSFPRKGRKGGGIAIVSKKEIDAILQVDVLTFTSFECIQVRLKDKIIVCIYHPGHNKNKQKTNTLFLK